jgi:uncharacterized protein YcbK (DUF882 family)
MRYEHWRKVPETFAAWPYRWFKPSELADRRTGELIVNHKFMDRLDLVRSLYARPLTISSGTRSAYSNALAGGAPRSFHLFGLACDISVINQDKRLIQRLAADQGFTGFGYYRSWLHIDLGSPRSWGVKWNA